MPNKALVPVTQKEVAFYEDVSRKGRSGQD